MLGNQIKYYRQENKIKQGELQLAIQDYERIIRCLKEDYHVTEGEQKEQYEREMKRLRRKLDWNWQKRIEIHNHLF